ncbi:hypothetical protein EXN22_16810 [Pseudomonas tructae]|uniref:Uncharacterized protein n=1 Tax=Pseudomonas tructae TaxID=2518644 RepID=A0A411MKF2_9PSED|nr:hypothetical protein [Pseudomonas tructae]QBF27269.1 hypothetical protein EXN22_16810 [Pseudomonas tructae]
MKYHSPRILLVALFALAGMASASATSMKTPTPVSAPAAQPGNSPWPTMASIADKQPATLLAHDDRYWHDDRWHDRRDDWRRDNWRREQWRREQARREAARRHEWERRHDRAMRHRYEEDRRYYRR